MKTTHSRSALYLAWMQEVPAHLQNLDGIKYQLAAAACVVTHLELRGCGWSFVPTTPGSEEDRRGIDGYLKSGGTRIPVDFSLESEHNPAGHKKDAVWLVHMRRDWFAPAADGTVQVVPSCETHLFRSFLPVLQAGMSLMSA
ncbi:hypothetical protein BH10CYA1_BH10CYA1_41650 [soil metagenome]